MIARKKELKDVVPVSKTRIFLRSWNERIVKLKTGSRLAGKILTFRFIFSFLFLFAIVGGIFGYFLSTRADIINVYPSSCLGDWEIPQNAQGQPDLDEDASIEEFNESNSAVLRNAIAQIFCSGFSGEIAEDTEPKNARLKFSLAVKGEGMEVPVEIIEIPETSPKPSPIEGEGAALDAAGEDEPEPTPEIAPESSFLFNRAFAEEEATTTIETPAIENPTIEIVPSPDFLEILYTFDGANWQSLGKVNYDNWQNLALEVPNFTWEDLSKIQIRIQSLINADSIPIIYLDGLWLEVEYESIAKPVEILSESEFEQIKDLPKVEIEESKIFDQSKNVFQANEGIDFEIDVSGIEQTEEPSPEPSPQSSPLVSPSAFFRKIFNIAKAQYDDFKVAKLEFLGPDRKKANISYSLSEINGKLKIDIEKNDAFMPGKYRMEVNLLKDNKIIVSKKEFILGVLAINTNKSIYLPEENAYLQMGVLDDEGRTVCDANLVLSIKYLVSSSETILSTGDGGIQLSGKCGPSNVTDMPDYFANYKVEDEGVYEMKLTNLDNGYEITDSFEVKQAVPFEVERIGPTRIYPFVPYEMKFKIKANQDFNGKIQETVPVSFEIRNPKSEIRNNFQIQNSNNQNEKVILWNVELKKGEIYELSYEFDAPDVSPQLYLLGQLQLMETKFPTGNLVSLIFQEARSWQIASDAGFKVSMAIFLFDKDGARAKQGDIIAIKPSGWQWGTKEYEQFLIMEIDLGNSITTWEDAQKLTVPVFETGELWWPSDDLAQPKIIGKRRYKISFADLDKKAKEKGITVDFKKMAEKSKDSMANKKVDPTNYQPLEKITLVFDDLIQDKVLNKKLGKAELKIIKDIGK